MSKDIHLGFGTEGVQFTDYPQIHHLGSDRPIDPQLANAWTTVQGDMAAANDKDRGVPVKGHPAKSILGDGYVIRSPKTGVTPDVWGTIEEIPNAVVQYLTDAQLDQISKVFNLKRLDIKLTKAQTDRITRVEPEMVRTGPDSKMHEQTRIKDGFAIKGENVWYRGVDGPALVNLSEGRSLFQHWIHAQNNPHMYSRAKPEYREVRTVQYLD